MKLSPLLIIIFFVKVSIVLCQVRSDLDNVREWKQLDFIFPNNRARDDAIRSGAFIAANTFPIDADVDYYG